MKKKTKIPGVRNLKIQSLTRENLYSRKTVPEIKLCGNWLAELGFHCEERVEIYTSEGLIVIRPEENWIPGSG